MPKPAAVPAAEGAGSPAKAAKADGDEGEQVQLAEDGKTVEAADVAMDGAAPAEGEKKDAATKGDKPEEKEKEKEKEKENGAAAADIPDPNPAGAAKDPSADDEPVALKDDGKTAEASPKKANGKLLENGAAAEQADAEGEKDAEGEEEAEAEVEKASWVPGAVLRVRAPQKCLDFYESHLKFRVTAN
ncbi:hypothetical protein JCM10213v2_005374 [Rhodosporidiobolus nylandii]